MRTLTLSFGSIFPPRSLTTAAHTGSEIGALPRCTRRSRYDEDEEEEEDLSLSRVVPDIISYEMGSTHPAWWAKPVKLSFGGLVAPICDCSFNQNL